MTWKNSWKKTTWLKSPFSAPHQKRQAAKKFITEIQLESLHAQMVSTINQLRAVKTQTALDRANKVLAISKTQVEYVQRAQEILQRADI